MPIKLVPPREGKTPNYYGRGTYLGQYVDRSTGVADRRSAKRIIARWQEDIERGQFSRPGEPTFLSAAVDYMKAGGERRFIERLLDHFGETRLALIDQAAIDNAAFALYPEASPATRNRQVYTVISAILKQAGMERALRRPKGAAGRVKTEWLWPEQAFRLFVAAAEIDAEFALFLQTLCYTGMRLGEALHLTTDSIRLAESFAFIAETKNDDPRPVFLPPFIVSALANHPRGLERPGRLFRFRKSGRLYALLAKARAATGPDVAFVTFHSFRHTWATWMRRYGSLDTKGLVGTGAWRDVKSAGRYEHVVLTEEAKRATLLPTPKAAK